MDISPPETPIQSLRAFLSHIATVTCGILIALTLEQLVEHHRHTVLVRHTRADFLAEMEANRTRVMGALASDKRITPIIHQLADYTRVLLKHPTAKPVDPDIDSSRTFGHLSASAWETALATQALNWMRFPEAHAYSVAYTRQATMNELESRARDQWFDLAGFDIDPTLPDTELREALRGLLVASAYADVMQKVEMQVLEAYDQAEAEARQSK